MSEDLFKYRILVVEDSSFNQFVLHKILGESYHLAQAMDGAEAMRKVHEFHPHLILLDIVLPDANGFDILVRLKKSEETRRIPVIIITGLNSDEDEEKGFLLGAVDYIKRPFKNAIIRARINTQIHIIRQMEIIEQMGLMDELTQISNRRAFDIRIRSEWERAVQNRTALSMLMMDIDKFKTYNDTYGHPQGDLMLRSAAKALRAAMGQSSDLLFRYGGEEFAVLLPDATDEKARTLGEALRRNVEVLRVPCAHVQTQTQSTISVGAALMRPADGGCPEELMEKADRMLYQAKANGRNRVECG